VYIYNEQMSLIRQINSNQIPQNGLLFSCTLINDILYLGTKETYSTTLTSSTCLIILHRQDLYAVFCPANNATSLWTVFGDYDVRYNPYDLDNYGISKYNNEGWLNIPYDKVLGAEVYGENHGNPAKRKRVYASSFFSGMLK
jgi:hypothetical protein